MHALRIVHRYINLVTGVTPTLIRYVSQIGLLAWIGLLLPVLAQGAQHSARVVSVAEQSGPISVSASLDYVEQSHRVYTIEDILADQAVGVREAEEDFDP